MNAKTVRAELTAIRAELATLRAAWDAAYGTPEGDAIKAQIDELTEREFAVAERLPASKARIARHCNDHGAS